MSDAPAENKAEAAAPASGGGGGKVVLILTALNLLVTAGLGGVLFVSFQKDKVKPRAEDISTEGEGHGSGSGSGSEHGSGSGQGSGAAASKKKNSDFGKMIPLEQFVVNLSTPGGSNPKFFRLNAALEVPNEDTEAEVNSKIPQIRNAIIDLINSKRASDVATVEGRDYLKEEIRNALNGFMVNGKVKGVFFTSFSVSN